MKIRPGRGLGGPKSPKMAPREAKASKIGTKGSKDGPKEAKRDPQIGPRGAKGRQMEAKFRPLGLFLGENQPKKDENVIKVTPIMKIYENIEFVKTLKNRCFFMVFSWFLVSRGVKFHEKSINL